VKTLFLSSFLRDVKKLPDAGIRRAVKRAIQAVKRAIQKVESASDLLEINSIKRLSGHPGYYRIRLGEYRLGLKIE
jgi:mRNA interferase RelE/StbE